MSVLAHFDNVLADLVAMKGHETKRHETTWILMNRNEMNRNEMKRVEQA